MKKSKTFLALICAALMCGTCAFAIGGCSDGSGEASSSSSEVKREKPEITVDAQSLTGTAGEAVTLPAAVATDSVDGDISAAVKMNVYFDRDSCYVFPASNAQAGTAGNVANSFVPKKVGTYVVIYNVKNSANMSARKEITLTVSASTAEREQQLLSDRTKWTMDTIGTAFDGEGNIVLNKTGDPSVSYNGKKLGSGDTVSFRFNADPHVGTAYYFVNAQMSASYGADAPATNEAYFPKRLFLWLRSEDIHTYFASVDGKSMPMDCGIIKLSVCDGRDHVISMRNTLDTDAADKVIKTEIWVDQDIDEEANYVSEITESSVIEFFGQETFEKHLKDMFDEEKFGGWFNVGAWRNSVASDTMRIKAATINGESLVAAPTLVTKAPENAYTVNGEIVFPAATAEDGNDYSDITSRIELAVQEPGGGIVKLEGYSYTPTVAGRYMLIYSVSDRCGNKEFAYYDFSVSKGASTEAPVLTLADDTENLTSKVGQEFAIPAVATATDSFGDDISSLVEVRLLGQEAKELTGETNYTFWSAGVHTIEYSVTDYNGNKTVKNVEVTVATHYDKVELTDFYTGGAIRKEGDFLRLADGDAAARQKIYSEKVSVIVDLEISSSYQAGDGINWVTFNMRGGKNLTTLPSGGGFSWPSGLNFELSSDGIKIYGAAHSDQLGGYSFAEGGREFFAKGEAEISWQVTDVYNEGKLSGVKVEMWVNGEKIKIDTAHKSGDDMFLSARLVSARPAILQAGWLQVYVNGDSSVSYLRAMTIDGSKPAYLTAALNPADTSVALGYGEKYTLPVVTAKYGDADVSADVKKFVWINGEAEPDYTTPFTEDSLTVAFEHIKGFKIIYRYRNKTIATVSADVDSEISEVKYSSETENLSAKIGEVFAYPTVTSFKIGDLTITEGITVTMSYGGAIREREIAGEFIPRLNKNFTLNYYYGTMFISSLEVGVTGGRTGDLAGEAKADGDYKYLDGQQVYDELVSLKFTTMSTSFPQGGPVDIILREIAPNTGNPWMDHNWPGGLRFRLGGDGIKVCYDRAGNGMLMSSMANDDPYPFPAVSENGTEYVLTWRVTDVYENDVLTGIRVEAWLNGEKVEWKRSMTNVAAEDVAAGFIPMKVLESVVAKSEPEYEARDTLHIFAPGYTAVVNRNKSIEILEWYIDGTEAKAFRFALDPASAEASVKLGEAYALPDVTATLNGKDVSSEVKVFVWINGAEEPDYTTPFTAEDLAVGLDYAMGFKLVYRYDGKTVAVVSVAVNAEVSGVTYSSGTEKLNAKIGEAFAYPTVTSFKLGELTVSEGITMAVSYPGTAIAEQEISGEFIPRLNKAFILKYYYGTTFISSLEVGVTGGRTGNLAAEAKTDGDYKYLDGQQVYDEFVSLKFKRKSHSIVDIMLRDFTPNKNGVWWDRNWPCGLRMRIGGDGIKICYDRAGHGMLMSSRNNETLPFPSELDAEEIYTLTYRVSDVFDDRGVLIGIRVEAWLNGAKIEWVRSETEVSDADLATGFIPLSILQSVASKAEAEYEIRDAASIFKSYVSGMTIHDASLEILEWYIDGTKFVTEE